MAARIIILLLFSIRLGAQSETDSFLIEEKDFKGYIMPLSAHKSYHSEDAATRFLPSQNEVLLAEEILGAFLKEMCHKPDNYHDKENCKIINTKLPTYFRQFASFQDSSSGHRIMYVLLVSERMQSSIDGMKTHWRDAVKDGGPIQFHAYIDLDAGKVIDFHDNGEA